MELSKTLVILILAFTVIADLPIAIGQLETQPPVQEFHVPTADSAPLAITCDQNGNIWFTESNATKLAKFYPSNGTFREYIVPWAGDMWGIVADSTGSIWFTQYSGKGNVNPGGAIVQSGNGRIVQFNVATEKFTSIPIPSQGSFPMRLTLDKHQRIWFTEFLANKIAEYDPAVNQIQEFLVPTNSSGPSELRFDSQGMLWFSESYARQVGMFNPENKKMTEFALGTNSVSDIIASPVGLDFDAEGNLWVADHGGSWIVKFNPRTSSIMKYPTHTPPPEMYPISLVNDLLVDLKGNVWFVEHAGNSIGYYNPNANTMIEFPIPTGPMSTTLWLTLAPNGDVWFAEWNGNNIGVTRARPLQLSIATSTSSLTLHDSEKVTVSMSVRNNLDSLVNGTIRYNWSSYRSRDISANMNPRSFELDGHKEISVSAELGTSNAIFPGQYTLALGVETRSIRIWTFIPVTIVKSNPNSLITNPYLLILVVLALGTFFVLIKRKHDRVQHE